MLHCDESAAMNPGHFFQLVERPTALIAHSCHLQTQRLKIGVTGRIGHKTSPPRRAIPTQWRNHHYRGEITTSREAHVEAFEQFVALAMEAEGLVVSGALKFPVRRLTQKQKYEEWQTHGYEVDLIGASSDRLVLATVKSFFGSRGVVSEHVMGEKGDIGWYAMLNQPDIREGVVSGACERFGYRLDQVEMRLYVGKFAGGGHEERIRDWAASQQIGGGALKVVSADRVVSKVREVARSKQYRDSPVLATLKVLEATNSLTK